jgi:hypothetical protein
MSTIRIKTRVLPGGGIELEEELPKPPLSEILGDDPGGRMFKTVEDVDR